jgi:hypothetical protein
VFLDAAGAAWTTDGDNTDRKLGAEVWTLEGDHELYAREPVANRRVELLLSEVVTSFRFGSAGSDERLARHYLKVKATDPNPLRRFIVLERPDPLPRPADPNLFRDPPFPIGRSFTNCALTP